jgi:hypothetical protein
VRIVVVHMGRNGSAQLSYGTAMKSSGKKRVLVLSLIAVLAAITGCSSNKSLAQQWGDRQLGRSVKRDLGKDPKYKFPDVDPVAFDGTVQLTGFVDTLEERQRAAEIAAHTTGVREVVNSISLKPTPTGKAPIREGATNAPPPGTSTAPQPPASTAPAPTEQPSPPTEPPPGQPPTPPAQPPQ